MGEVCQEQTQLQRSRKRSRRTHHQNVLSEAGSERTVESRGIAHHLGRWSLAHKRHKTCNG
eukprot:9799397-Heterocapsa_arctica.AAC.1